MTAMYAYLVYTVNARFGLTGETVAWGESADSVLDATWARGCYRRVEVAPCAPVNGFSDLPYRSGDTASRAADNLTITKA